MIGLPVGAYSPYMGRRYWQAGSQLDGRTRGFSRCCAAPEMTLSRERTGEGQEGGLTLSLYRLLFLSAMGGWI